MLNKLSSILIMSSIMLIFLIISYNNLILSLLKLYGIPDKNNFMLCILTLA